MKTHKMKKSRFLLASVGAAILQLSIPAIAHDAVSPVQMGQYIDNLDKASQSLKSALDIKLPLLEFVDLPLPSALRYLADRCKELDPAKAGFKYDIRIENADLLKVNMVAEDQPFDKLLDMTCKTASSQTRKINARLEGDVVVITAEEGMALDSSSTPANSEIDTLALSSADASIDSAAFVQPARPLTAEEIAIIKDQKDQLNRDIATRQSYEAEADLLYRKGQASYFADNFGDAVAKYQTAIIEIRKCYSGDVAPTRIQRKINSYRQAIYQSYKMWSDQKVSEATALFSTSTVADIDSAITYLHEAKNIYPENSAKIDPLLREAERIRIRLLYREATTPDVALFEDNKSTPADQRYSISVEMRKGNNAYKARNFSLARESFENVLRLDPYHREATEALRKVHAESLKAAERRFRETRAQMISEVIFKSVTPLPRTSPATREEGEALPVAKFELPVEKKLNEIIIDHLSFDDVSIEDAFRFVASRSRELDPEKKGVNFVIQVKPPAGGGDDENNAVAAEANDYFRINMVIDDQPLSNVVDVICKAATRADVEVKKSVEQHAVLIYSSNVAISNLETKIWPLEAQPPDMPADDAASLKDYFISQYSIQFPEGTSAIYDAQIGRLIVTNTLDRIKAIDDIVQEYKSAEPQAMIETRFVEVAQKDIQELGIDWMLTRMPPDGASARSIPFRFGTAADLIPASTGATEWVADATSPTGYRLLEIEQPTATALRSLGNNGIGNNYVAPGEISDKAFWWRHTADRRTGSSTNPNIPNRWGHDDTKGVDIDIAIRALSQQTTTDVLATPRVTAMNGEPAMIRMVTEVYYPTEWTEPETFSMTNNNYNFNTNNNTGDNQVPMGVIGSTPVFGETTQIGIRLDVTPHIDPGLELITLEMTPQILSFAGWNEYSYSLDVNGDGILDAAEEQVLKMPIIETRAVSTNVTIRDAETLVLGGALREKSYAIRDKIPFLGDLPLAGRLFRTDATVQEKTNLLIFLNCRIVKPDGEPHRGETLRGIPADR